MAQLFQIHSGSYEKKLEFGDTNPPEIDKINSDYKSKVISKEDLFLLYAKYYYGEFDKLIRDSNSKVMELNRMYDTGSVSVWRFIIIDWDYVKISLNVIQLIAAFLLTYINIKASINQTCDMRVVSKKS